MSNHGLTADNMMQQFPIALQKDPKTVALGQAIAKVMGSRQDEIDSLRIYTRIDELPEWLLDILLVTSPWTGTIDPTPLRKKEKPSRTASMFTGTVAQKRLLKEPFLRFIPIPKFWSGLSTAAIRTTSNSVSRLISLQSMRPNISRFCKKSSATKIFGRIWTASFTTRKRSRKRAMLQRFPAPQRCPTRFLCRVLSSRGQSAHTPAPLVRSAQLG